MKKWIELLSCLGGGRQHHFDEDFFSWFDSQIWAVDEYRYAKVDFRHDPNMVLSLGEVWDDSTGMLSLFTLFHF